VVVARVEDYGDFLGWTGDRIARRWRENWGFYFNRCCAEMRKAELLAETRARKREESRQLARLATSAP
jgi:hypothetical protein